jgi:hypothetical protein
MRHGRGSEFMNILAIFGVSALMSLVSSVLIARLTKEEEGFLTGFGMTGILPFTRNKGSSSLRSE